MSGWEFDAVIEEARGGGALVRIPPWIVEELGTKGRVPVEAQFDGHAYRGSLAPMGGCHLLGIRKDIRLAIGKSVGDTVHVAFQRDTQARTVEVPAELQELLEANPDAHRFFQGLAYTYQKEYARWIAEAKRPETRRRRLAKTLEKLTQGRKLS